jgi:hypothetical protein
MTPREVRYEARGGHLTQRVTLADGRSYAHCCTAAVLGDVAWALREGGTAGMPLRDVRAALPGVPWTAVQVALSFLADHGCAFRLARRWHAASVTACEDALEVFYHLAEVGG